MKLIEDNLVIVLIVLNPVKYGIYCGRYRDDSPQNDGDSDKDIPSGERDKKLKVGRLWLLVTPRGMISVKNLDLNRMLPSKHRAPEGRGTTVAGV